MGCQPARLRPVSPDTPKPAMIGQRVVVKGQQGIVALDNGDGTWNVEFDDDGAEGDFPLEDLEPAPNPVDAWCPAGAKLVAFPFTEKRPEGWTRFACFSDTHGLHDLIPRQHMPEADVLLHAGDFTNSGELEQIASFAAWLRAYPAPHKVVVAGNHDITFQEDYYRTTGAARFHRHLAAPYDCRKAREPLREWYIEDELREVRGYRIYGTPWQPAFCDWAFNLPRGEKLAAKWRQIPAETDLLLVHGPAFGHVDASRSGPVGCEDLLQAVRRRKLAAVVSGHLHEAYGCSAEGQTLFVNASTCTREYNPTRPPIVFDLPAADELRAALRSS